MVQLLEVIVDQINAVLQNGKLESIGPAPAFELVNQNNVKVTNETYKGKQVCFRVFLHHLS
jgi:protein SCO1/2